MTDFSAEHTFSILYREIDSRLFYLPMDLKRYLLAPMLLGNARIVFLDSQGFIVIDTPGGTYINRRKMELNFTSCGYMRCGWVVGTQVRSRFEMEWIGYHGVYDRQIISCNGVANIVRGEPTTVAEMRSDNIVIHTKAATGNGWDIAHLPKPAGINGAYSRVAGWDARRNYIILWDGGRKVMLAYTRLGWQKWKVCRREFSNDCCSVCWDEIRDEIRGITSWGYDECLRIHYSDLA